VRRVGFSTVVNPLADSIRRAAHPAVAQEHRQRPIERGRAHAFLEAWKATAILLHRFRSNPKASEEDPVEDASEEGGCWVVHCGTGSGERISLSEGAPSASQGDVTACVYGTSRAARRRRCDDATADRASITRFSSNVGRSSGARLPFSISPPAVARLAGLRFDAETGGLDGHARHASRRGTHASRVIPQSLRRFLQVVSSARCWLSWQDTIQKARVSDGRADA
jgi:hypothetical protein